MIRLGVIGAAYTPIIEFYQIEYAPIVYEIYVSTCNPQVASVDIPGPSSLSQADAGPATFPGLMQAPAANSSPRSSVSA